jgi:hypothetical protein
MDETAPGKTDARRGSQTHAHQKAKLASTHASRWMDIGSDGDALLAEIGCVQKRAAILVSKETHSCKDLRCAC